MRILIAGGGTGGHVLAGTAIADEWRKAFGANEILFVGARGGLEEKLVPAAGYPLELLSLGALNRVGWVRKLKTAFQLPFSFLKSIHLILKFKPQVVLGVGGYASGPVVLMARLLSWTRLLRARVAVLEQNSVPGLTNRILGRLADVVLAAFPGLEKFFPGKEIVVTGNPIRSVMKPLPPARIRPFTIFVFGGSQGAVGINTLVLEALPFLKDLSKDSKEGIHWIHQTGVNDWVRVQQGHARAESQARVEKFVDQMADTYAQASLLICRAGSSTLAEIAAVGRASVLVPLPTAADNHQEENAQVFVRAGGARLFRQRGGTGETLAQLIRELMNDPGQLAAMEKAVARFYRPDAAPQVVERLRAD
jgi:UDP-N-acetylglucosamine--N-acetylmuramyl-(pentapeptide) pyrophosphoryl-undecaprenol N-acetylglucosamine transferase